MSNKKNNVEEFFKAFADSDDDLNFKFTHEVTSKKFETISTASYVLDDALSCGGLPKGRIIQYYGSPGSGKTLMSMLAIKEAQKESKNAKQLFIDAEQTYDPAWAIKLGIDPTRVMLVDGDLAANGRKCFTMLLGEPKKDANTHILKGKAKEGILDKIANKEKIFGDINLIILDSIGAIIPPGDDVAAVGKITMGKMAAFLTKEFKKLSVDLSKAKVPMICINHKKDNLDPYGMDHSFSGGNSYAHHLSANIYFKSMNKSNDILDEEENKVGGKVLATVEKSKFGPWPRKCEITIDFRAGVVGLHEEIASLAIKYGVINKLSAVSYEYEDFKWRGLPALQKEIESNDTLQKELLNKIENTREESRRKELEKQEAITESILASQEEEVEEDEE